jgi:hypothetical protein
MKSNIIPFFATILALLSLFLVPTLACKCRVRVNDAIDTARTYACCVGRKGEFVDGNDCRAGSIQDKLRTFHQCCKFYGRVSDCRCPFGCRPEEV